MLILLVVLWGRRDAVNAVHASVRTFLPLRTAAERWVDGIGADDAVVLKTEHLTILINPVISEANGADETVPLLSKGGERGIFHPSPLRQGKGGASFPFGKAVLA